MRNLVELHTLAHSPSSGRGRRSDGPTSGFKRFAILAAASLMSWLLSGADLSAEEPLFHETGLEGGVYSTLLRWGEQDRPVPARAQEASFHGGIYRDDAFSTLRDFARQLDGGGQPDGGDAAHPAPVDAAHPARNYSRIDDDSVAALRDFVQRMGTDEAPGAAGHLRLAQAEQPKAKAAKGAPAKASKAPAAPAGPVDAHAVGSPACLTCHASQAAAFAQTLMGKYGKVRKGTMECESCHGPGSLHVKAGGGRGVGGLITFRNDDPTQTVEENNAICLACHERGDRTLWRGSTHELQNVSCTSCHTVMRNVTPKFQLAKLTELDTCAQCHKNKRAEIWRSSHMPVREGKMKCSTCHNPHGSFSEALLKEATVNDGCYKCHAEKRGPFLWEHAPVRESCTNCHDAHGSINDAMLKVSRPRLCQQCHANLTGHPGNPRNPTSVYAINRECQNCHSTHHGSNSPAGSRFIR